MPEYFLFSLIPAMPKNQVDSRYNITELDQPFKKCSPNPAQVPMGSGPGSSPTMSASPRVYQTQLKRLRLYLYTQVKNSDACGEMEYLSTPELPSQHQFILLSASIHHAPKHHGLPLARALISAQIPPDKEALSTRCTTENPPGL